jgi:hypothetical protein
VPKDTASYPRKPEHLERTFWDSQASRCIYILILCSMQSV